MAQGIPPIQQVTPQAPTYSPSLAPQQPMQMPQRRFVIQHPLSSSPVVSPQALIQQAQNPQSPGGVQVTKSEAERIIEALSGRLKHLSESEKLKMDQARTREQDLIQYKSGGANYSR